MRLSSINTVGSKRGFSIIPVIAFFAIALTMIGIWVRSSLGHRHVTRRWHEKTQSVWLAEAGVRRAVARLKADRSYGGETWSISPQDTGYLHAAEVEIRIQPEPSGTVDEVSDRTALMKVIAIARYPAGDSKRVQSTKTIQYRLPQSIDSSGGSS